jgi:hypothetical protein
VDQASNEVKDIIDEVAGETLYRYGAIFSAFPVSEGKLGLQKYNPLLINPESGVKTMPKKSKQQDF